MFFIRKLACRRSFYQNSVTFIGFSKKKIKTFFLRDYCLKLFSIGGSLKMHEKIHISEKTFQCDQYSKIFSQNCDLNKHKVNTGEKLFSCDYCLKLISTGESLKMHEIIHISEKPLPCD